MSSQAYSRGTRLVICALALAAPLAGCGQDSESSSEVADRVTTAPEMDTTPSAPTTATEAERAAARRAAKRMAAKRARARKAREEARAARRERQRRERAATTTTPPSTTTTPAVPDSSAAQTTPKPKPKPKPPAETGPTVHHVVETANLKLVTKKGVSFIQQGTVTGTVSGSMRLDAKLGGKGVEGTFVVTLKDGTLTGQASAALTLDGSVARFKGTATMAKGTGAYADLVPAELAFSGTVASDASTSTVKLAGDLRY